MATDPAAKPPRRSYWQLPTFAVGVAAAVLAWRAFPVAVGSASQQVEQDRYTLRQALGKRPVDVKEVEGLLGRLGDAGTRSDGNADTAFAQGSAHLLVAEERGGADHWQRAHALLAECDGNKLTDKSDRGRLAFRAAKAAAGCGAGEPATLLPALETVPPNEEPGERARLIADVCLRLNPKDVKRAKQELAGYLSGPPRGTAEQAAKLKLQLADLFAESGDRPAARTWLKEVGDGVPAGVQAEVKLRLARLALADGDVNEAVKQFSAADALPDLPPAQQTLIRYETGRGLVQLGNPAAGKQYLVRAMEDGGPVAAAAAVRLAELDPAGGAGHLEAAVKGTSTAAEWKNPHVTLAELRGVGEAAVVAGKAAGRYAEAVRAAEVLSPLAEGVRGRELLADVLTAWAAAPNVPDAAGKLKRAADEYQVVADAQKDEAAKFAYLQKAADALKLAGDATGAANLISGFAKQPGATDEAQLIAELHRADELLAKNRYPDAVEVLGPVATAAGPVGTKATLKLALAHAAEGKRQLAAKPGDRDAAKKIETADVLLTRLANATFTTADEKACQQRGLYELGRLQLSDAVPSVSNPSDAETRFRRLVTEYPSGEYADRGRMFLGIALSMLAQGAAKSGQPPADAQRKFEEARTLFEGLGESKDEFVRKQADIRLAHTLLHMKEYAAVSTTGTKLADKYAGKVEQLILLNIVHSGHVQTRRDDLAGEVLKAMNAAFAALPDAEFTNTMDEYTRAYWVRELNRKGK